MLDCINLNPVIKICSCLVFAEYFNNALQIFQFAYATIPVILTLLPVILRYCKTPSVLTRKITAPNCSIKGILADGLEDCPTTVPKSFQLVVAVKLPLVFMNKCTISSPM